jgi:hypothetical protein
VMSRDDGERSVMIIYAMNIPVLSLVPRLWAGFCALRRGGYCIIQPGLLGGR